MNTRLLAVVGVGLVAAFAVIAQELPDRPVAGWLAPPYWLPSSVLSAAETDERAAAGGAVGQPSVRAWPLVAVPPCRLLDTESEGRPALLRGESLEIAVRERCGVPATAWALSVRLGAVKSTADGALALRVPGKEGDHNGQVTLDRAKVDSVTGVVPLDASGRLVIFSAATSSEVVLDVNGYYATEPAVRSLNALAGDVTLQAGESIAITSEGNTVTISLAADERSAVDQLEGAARPQVRSVVQVQPGKSSKALPPVRAMAPPSSSMYVGGAFGLPDTTVLGAGVVTLGGDRFLHNYGPNVDAHNTFVGENAGNFTMGGEMDFNGTQNTGVGYRALTSTTLGGQNTAIGVECLASNELGQQNTASGYSSLYANWWGIYNTADGAFSLASNTGGRSNTASGHMAGTSNTTGSYNTFLGAESDASAGDLSNATALGYGAIVNASNKVRIGNGDVTVIEGQVAWSYPSDARLKEAVRGLDLGLDFVVGLRPVAFQMKGGNGRTDMGFLAQDIEALIGDGYNLLGIGQDAERTLSLRATDLIAPLVKAVQEQQAVIEAQRHEMEAQALRLDRLERELKVLMAARQPTVADPSGD